MIAFKDAIEVATSNKYSRLDENKDMVTSRNEQSGSQITIFFNMCYSCVICSYFVLNLI